MEEVDNRGDVPSCAPARADAYDPAAEIAEAVVSVRTAVRRQSGTEAPLGAKAVRTRAKLLDAAEDLLTRQGYLQTSPAQIAESIGVSEATFYQYFPDLKGLVVVLAGESTVEMLEQHVDVWDPTTGRIGLRRAMAAFVKVYFQHLDFFRLWEQVVHIDERLADLQRKFWAGHKNRFERTLRAGVDLGLVRADLDPAQMARALTHMTARYCYDVAIFDPPRLKPDQDEVIDTLTVLWADAIGLVEAAEQRRDGMRRRDRR